MVGRIHSYWDLVYKMVYQWTVRPKLIITISTKNLANTLLQEQAIKLTCWYLTTPADVYYYSLTFSYAEQQDIDLVYYQ